MGDAHQFHGGPEAPLDVPFEEPRMDCFPDLVAHVRESRARFEEVVSSASRPELAKSLWELVAKIYAIIKQQDDRKCQECWEKACDMLAPVVDFQFFNPTKYYSRCARPEFETRIARALKSYEDFLLQQSLQTRHLRPRELGETSECLYLEKPCHFTCQYGSSRLPPRAGAETSMKLLDLDTPSIQIHEYVALEYDHETAVGCRDFWRKAEQEGLTEPCNCGSCKTCACICAGCCHRLDRETSGVMIVAKTTGAYWHIRHQFYGDHNLQSHGMEKYYLALVCGRVHIPTRREMKSSDWIHESDGSSREGLQGRVEIALFHDPVELKSHAWHRGMDGPEWDDRNGCFRQRAVTLYRPLAWLEDSYKNPYTLLHLRIITGRTHQIRFHCSELGHPIVGDVKYGASPATLRWAKRVFLHSYQALVRDPSDEQWRSAVSPLPEDLGRLLSDLQLLNINKTSTLYLSREALPGLSSLFKKYTSESQLLQKHTAREHAAVPGIPVMSAGTAEVTLPWTMPLPTLQPSSGAVASGQWTSTSPNDLAVLPFAQSQAVALSCPRHYPADPHHKLRKAVFHNDHQAFDEALRGRIVGADKSGKTALHYAAREGRIEMMRLMLQHGLDPNCADHQGLTPLDEAEYWMMRCESEQVSSRREVRNWLAAYGGRRGNSDLMRGYYQTLPLKACAQDRPLPWHDNLDQIESMYQQQIPGGPPPRAPALQTEPVPNQRTFSEGPDIVNRSPACQAATARHADCPPAASSDIPPPMHPVRNQRPPDATGTHADCPPASHSDIPPPQRPPVRNQRPPDRPSPEEEEFKKMTYLWAERHREWTRKIQNNEVPPYRVPDPVMPLDPQNPTILL